jgi:hypothetical protein
MTSVDGWHEEKTPIRYHKVDLIVVWGYKKVTSIPRSKRHPVGEETNDYKKIGSLGPSKFEKHGLYCSICLSRFSACVHR